MDPASVVAWKPLGELLVEKGVITEPELKASLAEQERTGIRLGTILIARKLVSKPELTTVLAEQIGVELERQHGFGSGLFAEIARRNRRGPGVPEPARAPAPPAEVRSIRPAPERPASDLAFEIAEARLELESERRRRHELEEEVAALRLELEEAKRPRPPKRSRPAKSRQSRKAPEKLSSTGTQPES